MRRTAFHPVCVSNTHRLLRSVIITYFNVVCIPVYEPEADTPLIVDRDSMLPLPVPAQGVQPIPGRDPEIVEACREIDVFQLPRRSSLHVPREALAASGGEKVECP